MDWIEVTLYTSADGIEPVCGRLYQLGINGVSIEDEADFKDFLENNRACWDYVDEELEKSMHKETNVKFYLPNTSARRIGRTIGSSISTRSISVTGLL